MSNEHFSRYEEYWVCEYELAKLADTYQVSIEQMIDNAPELLTTQEYDYMYALLQRQSEILDLTHPHLKNVYFIYRD